MNARVNPFKGTGIALVTPFTANHEVDFAALDRLVQHCIGGGVDFLVALGTTAETATLSADEKQRVVAAICTAAAAITVVKLDRPVRTHSAEPISKNGCDRVMTR